MGGDNPGPITRVDGGPALNTTPYYYYDAQPVAKTVTGAGISPTEASLTTTAPSPNPGEQSATTTTTGRTNLAGADPQLNGDQTGGQSGRRHHRQRQAGDNGTGSGTTQTGSCSTINYGDAGSGAHDYDSWNPDPDRSHAAAGSRQEQWWQANDKLTADLKKDNCVYTVQFGDSLSTIAKRELVTEGKTVTKDSLESEMQLIVSLNDCHYQSLDNKRDRIQEGWKLVLSSDCHADNQPPPPAPKPPERPPQQPVEQAPPPPPPPRQQAELPPPIPVLPPTNNFGQEFPPPLPPQAMWMPPPPQATFMFGLGVGVRRWHPMPRPYYGPPMNYGWPQQQGGYFYGGQQSGGVQIIINGGGGGGGGGRGGRRGR